MDNPLKNIVGGPLTFWAVIDSLYDILESK